MKQLKFVIDEPSATGMSTLNFQDTLTIDPYSQIAMDKYFMTVPTTNVNSNDTNINLPTQIVSLNNNVNVLLNDSTATIQGGIYSTIADLVKAMVEAFNSTLDTTTANDSVYESDLGFRWDNYFDASDNLQIGFYRVLPEYMSLLAPTLINMSTVSTDSNGFEPSTVGAYQLLSNDASPILNGGLKITMNFQKGAITETSFGFRNKILIDPTDPNELIGEAYGIKFVDGQWYFFSLIDEEEITMPQYALIDFFVKAGDLRINITETDNSGVPIPNIPIQSTPSGFFTTFTFNDVYDFFIQGTQDPSIQFPRWLKLSYTPIPTASDQLGAFIQPKQSRRYLPNTVGEGLQSIVRWNYQEAPLLQQGLGLTQTIYYSPNASTWYYNPTNPYNFVLFYDFALETSSLPLQTFQARLNENGQRRNVIAYFSPIPVNANTSTTYYFDSKHLDFIDLNNEFAVNLNSLTFRVFDVNNDQNIIANYISFNLFVKSPKENLVKLIN